ncbi:MAG: glycosyltransferase family 39 protein [Planctomycetota bacterium]
MAGRRWIRWRGWLLPTITLLAVALPKLGQGDFRSDTGWYSAIALQAVRTGEWWTLYADLGQPYFNKPPLAFWVHGLALRIFGVSLEAARLPTVLAALGVVLATVGVVRAASGPRVALVAGMALALTYEFFRRTREISLDMWQLLWLMLAFWLVVIAWRRQRWGWLAVAGVPIGLALMTKPLVGLVVLPMVAAWLVWNGWTRRLGWLALGGVTAVLIAGPWHLSMWLIHGEEFARQYFGAEIAGRVEHLVVAADTPPWWWYAKLVGSSYWPWLAFVGLGLWAWLRGRGLSRLAAGPRLAIIWLVVWVVVLTVFPDKRPRYALVLWPVLAWVAGLWLANRPWAFLRGGRWTWEAFAAAAVVVGAVVSWSPVRVQRPPNPQWGEMFEWMRAHDVDEGELWQGAFTGIRGCRVYLEFGWWPVPTRNRWGEVIAEPPVGSLLGYHADDQLAPGANESVLFESGKLRVTRLGAGGWSPIPTAKPPDDGW